MTNVPMRDREPRETEGPPSLLKRLIDGEYERARSRPAATMSVTPDGVGGVTINQSSEVHIPQGAADDFLVAVSARSLTKCREKLGAIGQERWPFTDLWLAVAMAMSGIIVTLIIDGLSLVTTIAVVIFAVAVVVCVVFFALYFVGRSRRMHSARECAAFVLDELPDPVETQKVGGTW